LAAGGAAGATKFEDDMRHLLDVHSRSLYPAQAAVGCSAAANCPQLVSACAFRMNRMTLARETPYFLAVCVIKGTVALQGEVPVEAPMYALAKSLHPSQ
jgi:hypothetical protein